jgi:uncharacterized protein (DUF1697 family)
LKYIALLRGINAGKERRVDIRCVKGAVFRNLSRKDYNKSRLNKLIGRKFYKYMTNTASFFGVLKLI